MKTIFYTLFILFAVNAAINAQNLISLQSDDNATFYNNLDTACFMLKTATTSTCPAVNTYPQNDVGRGEVAPGIYYVSIDIDDSIFHRKIVLSK